ncbi:hypothetical protein L218DRAFT_991427 [Marasmius fiardii PR-910]|nr:hypothetical protein L218DRAFT_991427 [Marasmius fiardii PR-910]
MTVALPSSSREILPAWHDSYQAIMVETHNTHIEGQKESNGEKGTGIAYKRRLEKYQKWWDEDQFKRVQADPKYVPIPALPPTATKVVLWLQMEETKCCKDCAWRSDDPEVKIKLRDDIRIRQIEAAAKKNEMERSAKAQSLKVKGSSADLLNITHELVDADDNFTHKHNIELIYLLVDYLEGSVSTGSDRPQFEPQFGEGDPAEFGSRNWYTARVFLGQGGDDCQITYTQHYDIILRFHHENDIELSKVTHASHDLAVMFVKYPAADIFCYEPFNSSDFQMFSIQSKDVIDHAKRAAQLQLEKYPEEVQVSMQSVLLMNTLQFQKLEAAVNHQLLQNEERAEELGMKPRKCQKTIKGAAVAAIEPSPPLLAIEPPPSLTTLSTLVMLNNLVMPSPIIYVLTISQAPPLATLSPEISSTDKVASFWMYHPGTKTIIKVPKVEFIQKQEEVT